MSMVSEPLVQVVSSADVISSVVALVVALLGWVTWRIKKAQVHTTQAVERLRVHAARAASAAEQAAEQTTNSHGTNLRDDVDGLGAQLTEVLARLDEADRARRAAAEEVARRMARTEAQLDGLRDDVRALDGRLTRLDEHSDAELERLRQEIHDTHT